MDREKYLRGYDAWQELGEIAKKQAVVVLLNLIA
jgi:hypothetical protein